MIPGSATAKRKIEMPMSMPTAAALSSTDRDTRTLEIIWLGGRLCVDACVTALTRAGELPYEQPADHTGQAPPNTPVHEPANLGQRDQLAWTVRNP
jgi:hypothetical protein